MSNAPTSPSSNQTDPNQLIPIQSRVAHKSPHTSSAGNPHTTAVSGGSPQAEPETPQRNKVSQSKIEQTEAKKPDAVNHYPLWSPRFWHGMRFSSWFRFIARNRFKMSGPRVHISIGVTAVSLINELLALLNWLLFQRKIRKTEIRQAPIFILGHWRSGTTLLHELMVSDPRYASPNTFQCFAPSHFLISEYLMVRLGGFLLPKRRPMDNMEAGWSLPQEDEFALMNLGVPTPYLRIGFPETQEKHLDYLTMQIPDADKKSWCESFQWFLKALTYHYGGKRLVLKSPTHTGRVGLLSKLFPDAKFIHLTRDPVKMFPSTLRLWHSLEQVQALQESRPETEMEAYVGQCNQLMYQQFLKDREAISEDRIAEVRYEDLAKDPLSTMRDLYQKLDLGDFQAIEKALGDRLANHKNYVPNTHDVDDALRQKVDALWPTYCEMVQKPKA